jgi:hypothetical protein
MHKTLFATAAKRDYVVSLDAWSRLMSSVAATEIRLAGPEDDDRLSRFIQGFLSRNGFPFVMVSQEIDLSGGFKRVTFEDADLGRRFQSEWSASAGA